MDKPKKKFKVVVDDFWCKGCGICVHFCPKKVLEISRYGKCSVVRVEECIGCKLCELRCPDFAIVVYEDNNGQNSN